MHSIWSPQASKAVERLAKKDPVRYAQLRTKVEQILDHPEHFKPLRNILAGYRRVHIGNLVLIFEVEGDVVYFISLEHHDRAY